jgi:lysophospholipase L1-like esterase
MIRCLSRLAIASILVVSVARADSPAHSAVTPNERKDAGAVKRHEAFVARAAKGHVDVLFLGDSITQGWEGAGKKAWGEHFEKLHPANFGIGGDRTQHILWRLTAGKELEGIQPKVCVLMIGTNNMGSNSAKEIADGVEAIIKELHKQRPHMKVLLLAIFPRASAGKDVKVVPAAKLNPKIKETNDIIAKLDNGKTVKYLDIGPKFLDADGGLSREVMPDLLHLSPKGYEIWAKAISDTLAEMLK